MGESLFVDEDGRVHVVGAGAEALRENEDRGGIVGAEEEGRRLAVDLREECGLGVEDAKWFGERRLAELVAVRFLDLRQPLGATLVTGASDRVVRDVAPSVGGGVDEDEDFGWARGNDDGGDVGDGDVGPGLQVLPDGGRDVGGEVPVLVVRGLHRLAGLGDEAEKVEEAGDGGLEDLHRPPEEAHVAGETLPGPREAEGPGEVEFGEALGGDADRLVGEVEDFATPIKLGLDDRGSVLGVVVDGDLGTASAVEEVPHVSHDVLGRADEEDVVDLGVSLALLGEVEEEVGGGNSGVYDVLLAGCGDAETEETGGSVGEGEAHAEEVADGGVERELMVVRHEVTVGGVGAVVDELATFVEGGEPDGTRVGHVLVVRDGVLDEAEAVLVCFVGFEHREGAGHVAGGDGFDEAGVEHLLSVLRRDEGERDGASVRGGQVHVVEVGEDQVVVDGLDRDGAECGVVGGESEEFVEVDAEGERLDVRGEVGKTSAEFRVELGGAVKDLVELRRTAERGREVVPLTAGREARAGAVA